MNKFLKKFCIICVIMMSIIGIGMGQNTIAANAADGWTRYGKTSPYLTYEGNWLITTSSTYHDAFSKDKSAILKFSFTGTKLRFYSFGYTDHTNKANINIDGKNYTFSQHKDYCVQYCLDFEINNLEDKVHNVIVSKSDDLYLSFQALEISSEGKLQKYDDSISVDANKTLNLKDETIELETGYSKNLSVDVNPLDSKLIWSSSDESIATVDQTGKVTAVKEGESTITVKMNGTDLKDTCKVIVSKSEEPQPSNSLILNIEPEKEKIELKQNVTADVVIDNIKEIAAEDMIIKYDSEKLKFLGAEEVEGIKVVKSFENKGELRVILASQGISNAVFMKKTLLKLNFQGIAVGDAVVDITKGKISDGIQMERDLLDEECGQATITIEDYKDPSKDGAFTLLDLAIDGRYYGLNPEDYPQYKTDVVENGAIDDDDLLQIGQYMMENPNYSFNN